MVEIREEKRRAVDRTFASALDRHIDVPFEGDLYRFVQSEFMVEFNALCSRSLVFVPGLYLAIFTVFVDVNASSQVIVGDDISARCLWSVRI